MYYNINNLRHQKCDFFEDILNLNVDLFCFAETQHSSNANVHMLREKYNLYDVPGTKTSNKGRAKGGFVLGWLKMYDTLMNISYIPDHGIRVNLSIRKFKFQVIFVYFNPSVIYDDVCEKLVREIGDDNTASIIMGDFNARLGFENTSEVDRNSEDSKVNRRGKRIIQALRVGGFCIANGLIQGDVNGTTTFLHRNGNSTCVNDFLFYKKIDVSTFRVLPLTHSDHFPIMCTLPITNSQSEVILPQNDDCWKYDLRNEQKVSNYQREVNDYLGQIKIYCEEPNQLDQILKHAIEEAAKNSGILYKKPARKRLSFGVANWFDEECRNLRKIKNQSLRKWRSNPNKSTLDEYIASNKRYSETRDKKKEENENMIEMALWNHENSQQFWNTLNHYRRRSQVMNNIEKTVWYEHFKYVFERDLNAVKEPLTFDSNEEDQTIAIEEICPAISRLSSNKAPGVDNIPNELWKSSPPEVLKMLSRLFTKCYNAGMVPLSWCTSIICPIHKKGDKFDPTNYRPISLLPTILKIFTAIITVRLQNVVDNPENPKLCEFQAGFRQGRGCEDQIFTLNCIIQSKLRKKKGRLYACFVDFSQAFDSVPHGELWKKLAKLNVPKKMITVIRSIYEQATVKVRAMEGLTEEIKITKGVLQGETLSPNLFSLYLNDFVESISQHLWNPIKMLAKTVVALLYADDIVLLAANPCELKRALIGLEEYAQENKLSVNVPKTKIMIFRRGGRLRKVDTFSYMGEKVDIVNSFTYLGVPFASNGKFKKAHVHFKNKGLAAVGATLNLLNRFRFFKFRSWERIFNSLVSSTAMYCCSVWGGTMGNEVEKVQMAFFKRLLRLPIRTPNYLVRLELGLEHTKVKGLQRQLGLLVRILSNSTLKLAKNCLMHLNRHGSTDVEYNWIAQLKGELDLINMGWVLNGLNIEIIRSNINVVTEKMRKYYQEEDLKRIKKSSYITHYAKKSEPGDPEPYLLLHMNKVFTQCVASLRMNPFSLNVANLKLDLEKLDTKQCKFCPEDITIPHLLICKSKSDEIGLQSVGDPYNMISSDLDTHAYKSIYIKCKNWLFNFL